MSDHLACIEDIRSSCSECGLCAEGCQLLTEIGQSPLEIASRAVTAQEAFGCSLCGLCESVCPQELHPIALFAHGRREVMAAGAIDRDDYCYLMPDRPNGLSAYRQFEQIDYAGLGTAGSAQVFFPGCTMQTYTPKLLRAAMARLEDANGPVALSLDCCGKPLRQMGLDSRAARYEAQVVKDLQERSTREVIVACPGCYYALKKLLAATDIGVVTVYERMGSVAKTATPAACLVHDTCPDRAGGVFQRQLRDKLKEAGYTIREFEHSGAEARCCGSGGQVSHFRPDFRDTLLTERVAEARRCGGERIVSACASCVLNLSEKSDDLPVFHGLNLLLGLEEDYSAVKTRAGEMFQTEEGVLLWYEMMAADDPE